ncbi:hypothetical protein ACWELO_33005 [Streptomyces sp. NPDC004596]
MRYAELGGGEGEEGFADPRPCLERLPALAVELPPAARAFATGPGHYDFGGRRCVKDLLPSRVRRHGGGDVEPRFRHDCLKHDEDLLVRRTGVSRFQSDVLGGCDPASFGDVILDGILPGPAGRTYEPARRPGTLVVACRVLVAEWVPADRPGAVPHA